MKKYIKGISVGIVIIAVLAVAFFAGGDVPGKEKSVPENKEVIAVQTTAPTADVQATIVPVKEAEPTETPVPTIELQKASEKAQEVPTEKIENVPVKKDAEQVVVKAEEKKNNESVKTPEVQIMKLNNSRDMDKYHTEPVPEGKPQAIEPENVVISDKAMKCSLTVRCDTILSNMSRLDSAKAGLIPSSGVIFSSSDVTFYEGESVFNVLLREMKKNKIHFEFENTPIYNSAYIEGINNLYEFDCGELSGWMYRVNDWFPNYGCSRYQLKEGDVIEWIYTCDLGRDIVG